MNDGSGTTDFTLPDRSGVSTAHDLAAAGRSLEAGARLRVDAGAVTRISCATIIALISLTRAAVENGGAVIIRAPTNAFTDAFADLGLFESLMNMEFAE